MMTKDAVARYTLRLPTSLFEKLKQKAKLKGVSMNCYLITILWDDDLRKEEEHGDTNQP